MFYTGEHKTTAPDAHDSTKTFKRQLLQSVRKIDRFCVKEGSTFILVLDEQKAGNEWRERNVEACTLVMAAEVARNNRIVISAITYAEMRYEQIGKKASPKHKTLVDEFVKRLDEVLPWDQAAVDATVEVKRKLTKAGTIIGENDTAIAGHAIASGVRWRPTMFVNSAHWLEGFSSTLFEDQLIEALIEHAASVQARAPHWPLELVHRVIAGHAAQIDRHAWFTKQTSMTLANATPVWRPDAVR